MAVLHPKPLGDGPELVKTDTLVEMPGMDIAFHHGVELQDQESEPFCFPNAVQHQLLADMLAAAGGADRVAGVADMGAAADVIGVEGRIVKLSATILNDIPQMVFCSQDTFVDVC